MFVAGNKVLKAEQCLEEIIKGATFVPSISDSHCQSQTQSQSIQLTVLTGVLMAAPESEWNNLLINHLTPFKGDISPDELYAVIKKRIERTLIRTVCTFKKKIVFHFNIGIIKLLKTYKFFL